MEVCLYLSRRKASERNEILIIKMMKGIVHKNNNKNFFNHARETKLAREHIFKAQQFRREEVFFFRSDEAYLLSATYGIFI